MAIKLFYKYMILITLAITMPTESFCRIDVYKSKEDTISQNVVSYFELNLGDKEYVLDHFVVFQGGFDDNVSSYCVSYGSCLKNDCKVILRDSISGFDLELFSPNDSLLFCYSGIVMLKDVYFHKHQQIDSILYRSLVFDEIDVPSIKEQLDLHKQEIPIANFRYGRYKGAMWGNHVIEISDNGFYTYFSLEDEPVLSRGKWSREGNLLMFFDVGMKKPFYALIEEDGHITSYMPEAILGEGFYFQTSENEKQTFSFQE